jgi:chloramphenicol O-acetyltransferase type A
MSYRILKVEDLKNIEAYNWFKTFENPCFSFNVKMDVTKVLEYSHKTKTSFFINVLYLITKGCSLVEEMRIRLSGEEIRLYEKINPAFTVMTNKGIFANARAKWNDDYKEFYYATHTLIEEVKRGEHLDKEYNTKDYSYYYITCIPWLSMEGMTHPLPSKDLESLSVPRICWDKYREENGKIVFLLNITVNHMFVDGEPCSRAFNEIKKLFDNCEDYLR